MSQREATWSTAGGAEAMQQCLFAEGEEGAAAATSRSRDLWPCASPAKW